MFENVDGFIKESVAQNHCYSMESSKLQNTWEPNFGSSEFHMFPKIIIRTYRSNILLYEILFPKYQSEN